MGRQLWQLAALLRAVLGVGGFVFLLGPLCIPAAFGSASFSAVGAFMLVVLMLEAALRPGAGWRPNRPLFELARASDEAQSPAGFTSSSGESDLRFRELLDLQTSLVVCRDGDGRLTFVNRAFCETFGVEAGGVIGTSYAPAVLEEEQTESFDSDAAAPKRLTQRLQTVAGPRWFAWEQYTRHSEKAGRETVWIGTDISDSRAYQAMLSKAREQAEDASSNKTRMLVAAGEEVGAFAETIVSALEELETLAHFRHQKSKVRKAKESANTLTELATQLRDFATVEVGRLAVVMKPFNPEACVREAIAAVAQKALRKRVELALLCDEALLRPVVGDEAKLRQICTNLIDIALDATEHGSIPLRLSLVAAPGNSDQAALTFQVEANGSGSVQSGVRLTFARLLARAMGGSVTIENDGALQITLTLTLPLATKPVSDTPVDRPSAVDSKEEAPESFNILVAEDNPINAMLTDCMVRRAGCTSMMVETGRGAVQAIRDSINGTGPRVDLVLMDVHMPDLDGLQATREIRELCNENANNAHKCPPLIAVTADAYSEDRKACLEAGMNDYLSKPFSWPEFQAILQRWLRKSDNDRVAAHQDDAA